MSEHALEDICSRGPWTTRDGVFTGDDLHRLYVCIDRQVRPWPWGGSDRRTDRGLQLLRNAGLIVFDGSPKRWRST